MSFRQILVALDNSQSSKYAFEQALDLAEVQGSKLMLFHCFSTTFGEAILPVQTQLGISPNQMNDAFQAQRLGQEQERERVLAFLNECCDTATSQGLTAECDHQTGAPGPSICQAAQKWGADLIIIGRRGRSGITEALLGSVSNHVMHHAPCSVLVIQNNSAPPSEPLSQEYSD
jgi:nucleotide-binding universal stress UspA family protein